MNHLVLAKAPKIDTEQGSYDFISSQIFSSNNTVEKVERVSKQSQTEKVPQDKMKKVSKSKFSKSSALPESLDIKLPQKKRKLENTSISDKAPQSKRRVTEKAIEKGKQANSEEDQEIDLNATFNKTTDNPSPVFQIILRIEELFKQNADSSLGEKQKGWMRNQFPFLGISTPDRRKLQSPLFKKLIPSPDALSIQESIELIKLLTKKKEREFHYAAIDIAKIFIDCYPSTIIELFEEMIKSNSWWDTVDDIASNLVGSLVKKHPTLLLKMDNWISDSNLWIRRTALLCQLKWKDETDEKRLFSYCKKTMTEKEFFIQKAIGWALREYSKIDKQTIRKFIESHRHSLSPLSYSEASKLL